MANRLIRRLTGVQITDNGCSLKAYRRDLLDRISLYAEQHRFIPALSASVGARITELPVRHHARRFGESKYGISRTVKVLVDLITLKMITTFRSRPLVGFALAADARWCSPRWCSPALWVWAATHFGPDKADALVFPGAALLWLGAAFYLRHARAGRRGGAQQRARERARHSDRRGRFVDHDRRGHPHGADRRARRLPPGPPTGASSP